MTQKTTLRILKAEKKQAKNGKPYWRVQTDHGWMSCWILGIGTILETAAQTQSTITAETSKEGDFTNIINLPDETGATLTSPNPNVTPIIPPASVSYPSNPPLSPPDGRAISIKAQVCGYIASEIIAAMIEGGDKMSAETLRVKFNEIFEVAWNRITTAEVVEE